MQSLLSSAQQLTIRQLSHARGHGGQAFFASPGDGTVWTGLVQPMSFSFPSASAVLLCSSHRCILPLVPLIEGAMAMHLHSHAGLTTTTAFGVPGSGPLGRSSCSRVAAGNWCCTPSPILLNEGTAHGLLLEEFDNSWFKSWASEGADSA
jgi:hypothetical protein